MSDKHWKQMHDEVFGPYLLAHPHFKYQRTHTGGYSAIYSSNITQKLVQYLLTYDPFKPQLKWITKGAIPTNAVVKISAAYDNPPLWTAQSSSRNEIIAMARMTDFRSVHTPQLFGCCRFHVEKGLYLVVIIMERIVGRTWYDTPSKCRAYYDRSLKNALKELRGFGILHRDLHADNVILSPGRGAVIIDFGLCLVQNQIDWTTTDVFVGDHYDEAGYYKALTKAAGYKAPVTRAIVKRLGFNPDADLWSQREYSYTTSNNSELERAANAARQAVVQALGNPHNLKKKLSHKRDIDMRTAP